MRTAHESMTNQVMSDSKTMKCFALGMPPAAAVPFALSAKQASPFALRRGDYPHGV